VAENRIVAVGLLTQQELDRYGSGLKQVFPVSDGACFEELVRLIDEADREHWPEEERLQALQRLRAQQN
jgi:hypothetical protein